MTTELEPLPQICSKTGLSKDYANVVLQGYELVYEFTCGKDMERFRKELKGYRHELKTYQEHFPPERYAYSLGPEQQWRLEGLNTISAYLRDFADEKPGVELTNAGFEQLMRIGKSLIYGNKDNERAV